MAAGPPSTTTAAEAYRPNRFVSLPAELDPATYDSSPEKRRAEAERLALRARLKRQYQLQLNNPNPPAIIVSGERGGAGGREGGPRGLPAWPGVPERGPALGPCGRGAAVPVTLAPVSAWDRRPPGAL